MKDDTLQRIRQVYQIYRYETRKGVTKRYGPYWYGYWRENGRTRCAYVGRNLPPQLSFLIEKRKRISGPKQYRWPLAYYPVRN